MTAFPAGIGGMLTALLLLGPGSARADVGDGAVILLPAQGGQGVPRRQLARLQNVIDAATESPRRGAPQALSRRVVRRCQTDRPCLLRASEQAGARRVVESRLSRSQGLMQASMSVVDPHTGLILSESTEPMASKYRLRGIVEGLLEGTLAGIDAELGASDPGRTRADSGRGASSSASGPIPASSAPGYANVPVRPEGHWRGDDGAPPLPGTATGEAYAAKRAARDRSPQSFADANETPDTMTLDWRRQLAEVRSAARRDDAGGRRILFGLYLGLAAAAFVLGVLTMTLLPAVLRVVRDALGLDTGRAGKRAAENQALLRGCCKQLTPGIIMSTEFETVRQFHFADLSGETLTIQVTDYQNADESAFRPGAMVCAQFSHGRRACVALMVIKRAQQVRGRMRVQLRLPDHLADIVLPRHFHVPVPDRIELLGEVTLERSGEDVTFVARVADMSAETLSLKVDANTPELPLSSALRVSLRYDGGCADIATKYEGMEAGKLTLRVLPSPVPTGSQLSYSELFAQIEAAWVAPAA